MHLSDKVLEDAPRVQIWLQYGQRIFSYRILKYWDTLFGAKTFAPCSIHSL